MNDSADLAKLRIDRSLAPIRRRRARRWVVPGAVALAVLAGGAWMALRPHTGRTHQLRAHMKAIGHPIVGDPKYNNEDSVAISEGLGLQLHARRVELDHPSGGTLIIEAPISRELRAGFERFGFDEHEADAEPFRAGKKRR